MGSASRVGMMSGNEDTDVQDVGVIASGVGRFRAGALRRARSKRRLTLRDLAALSGVSAVTLHSWETGTRNPSPRSLAKVAGALDLEIGDLVPVTESKVVLEDLRVQQGLSQRDAAVLVGMGPTLFREIETGHKAPSAPQRAALMELYELDENEFDVIWERSRALLIRRLRGD